MLFQEPMVQFLDISSAIVTTESNNEAAWAACQQNKGSALGWNLFCIQMDMGSVTPAEGCPYVRPVDTNASSLDGPRDSNKLSAATQMNEAIAPAQTNAPVRSAPHFNNDLFN